MPGIKISQLRSAAGKTARLVRRTLDRTAHPLRRARLRRALRRLGIPRSVLFVCHGNICRSPYAAAAFERALPAVARSSTRIDSAGFIGPGRPAPKEAIAVASRRGIDLSTHQSKALTAELVLSADVILVMDARQRAALRRIFHCDTDNILVLGDADPEAITRRGIQDPVGQSERVFDASYTRIDRCISNLLSVFSLV